MEAGEPVGTVGERGDCGNERLDLDPARGDRFDCLAVFARRGATAEDIQLAGDDSLERKGDLGLEVTDATDAAAFADRLDCELDGGAESNDFEGDIGAIGIADQLADTGGDFVVGKEDLIRPEFFGEGETFFIEIDRDDHARAFSLEGLHDE